MSLDNTSLNYLILIKKEIQKEKKFGQTTKLIKHIYQL